MQEASGGLIFNSPFRREIHPQGFFCDLCDCYIGATIIAAEQHGEATYQAGFEGGTLF